MFITLECTECKSSMELDFGLITQKAVSSGRFSIKCYACDNQFPTNVGYALADFMKEFTQTETKWNLAFKLPVSEQKQIES